MPPRHLQIARRRLVVQETRLHRNPAIQRAIPSPRSSWSCDGAEPVSVMRQGTGSYSSFILPSRVYQTTQGARSNRPLTKKRQNTLQHLLWLAVGVEVLVTGGESTGGLGVLIRLQEAAELP